MPLVKYRRILPQSFATSGIRRRIPLEQRYFDSGLLPIRRPVSEIAPVSPDSAGEATAEFGLGTEGTPSEGSAEANVSPFGLGEGTRGKAEAFSLEALDNPYGISSITSPAKTTVEALTKGITDPSILAQLSLNPVSLAKIFVNRAVPYSVTARSLAREIAPELESLTPAEQDVALGQAAEVASETPEAQIASGILSINPRSNIARQAVIAKSQPKTLLPFTLKKLKEVLTQTNPEAQAVSPTDIGIDVSNEAVDAAMGVVGPNPEAIGPDVSNEAVDAMMGSIGGNVGVGSSYGGSSPSGPGPGGYGGGQSGEAGGAAGGGEGGTLLCTELHRQGLLPDEIYKADSSYGRKMDLETMRGYHVIAGPLVSLMQKSKLFTWFIKWPVIEFAKQAAFKENVLNQPNLIGSLIESIGIPICRFIGKRKLQWLTP